MLPSQEYDSLQVPASLRAPLRLAEPPHLVDQREGKTPGTAMVSHLWFLGTFS